MKKICFLACSILLVRLFAKQIGGLLGHCVGHLIATPLADAIANGAVVTFSISNLQSAGSAQNDNAKETDKEVDDH